MYILEQLQRVENVDCLMIYFKFRFLQIQKCDKLIFIFAVYSKSVNYSNSRSKEAEKREQTKIAFRYLAQKMSSEYSVDVYHSLNIH